MSVSLCDEIRRLSSSTDDRSMLELKTLLLAESLQSSPQDLPILLSLSTCLAEKCSRTCDDSIMQRNCDLLQSRLEAAEIVLESGCPFLIQDDISQAYDLDFSLVPSSHDVSSLGRHLSAISHDIKAAIEGASRERSASLCAATSIKALCRAIHDAKRSVAPASVSLHRDQLSNVPGNDHSNKQSSISLALEPNPLKTKIIPNRVGQGDDDGGWNAGNSIKMTDLKPRQAALPFQAASGGQEVIVLDEIESGDFYFAPDSVGNQEANARKDSKALLPRSHPSSLRAAFEPPKQASFSNLAPPPPPNRNPDTSVPGFKTAKSQLQVEMAKKGQSFEAVYGNHQNQPPRVAGLSKKRSLLHSNPNNQGQGGKARGPSGVNKAIGNQDNEDPADIFSEQVLGVIQTEEGSIHEEILKLDPKIVEMVCNEVLDSKQVQVNWDDIAGQETAKQLIQEIVVWPMQNPDLFTGPRSPPKGILLFGPPGTGKTLIGKAIACNINGTFFSISASSLTSKWIGEGEKMVRALFTVARHCNRQPCVIFIDEIDSILGSRKAEGEHESSRRLKTELLIQMDGCHASESSKLLVVAATNRPEELDDAARRRLSKQLYVPLPCSKARKTLVTRTLSGDGIRWSLNEGEIAALIAKTDGYSGADMALMIKEAMMGPVRDLQRMILSGQGSSRGAQGLGPDSLRPVVIRDFQVACKAQKKSVEPHELCRYEEYNEKHGAKYASNGMGMGEEEMDVGWD